MRLPCSPSSSATCGACQTYGQSTALEGPARVAQGPAPGTLRPMILGLSIATYTLLHPVLSLVGIVAGLVVAGALVTGTRLDRWAAVFLVTTVLANASGF